MDGWMELTSQTMEVSWLVPFSPRREHAAAKVSEPSPQSVPDDRSTVPCASSACFLSFPRDMERASPCSIDEICRILASQDQEPRSIG